MSKRFGRVIGNQWKEMMIRQKILDKKFKKMSGRVMFPTTHDIIDISPFKEVCFMTLEKLLRSGNIVLVTIKPRLNITRQITHEFLAYKEQIQFRFTITSSKDRLLRFWEPNAPRFQERLTSLRYAFQEGFKTSVSIEPFLDYDPSELVDMVTPFITESIWIGRMNYISRKNISEEEKPYYDDIRKNYHSGHLLEICYQLKKHPKIRFKDSVRNQLNRNLSIQGKRALSNHQTYNKEPSLPSHANGCECK